MKKLVSLVLAMAMVFTMSAVVFADTTTCDITVTGTTSTITYNAYKLMDLSVDTAGTAYTYTVNSKYATVLANAMEELGQPGVDPATYLSENTGKVQDFADAVYAQLGTTAADYTETATGDSVTFSGVEQGYYLIVETDAADENDSVSLVMLETAGNTDVTVATKEDVPEMTKKIKDTNDSTGESSSEWEDSADYDIGDDVPFRLTATMPSKLANYSTYAITFHDVMDEGLTFDANSVVVSVNGTTVASSCYSVLVKGTDTLSDETCTFEIAISDVKSLTDTNGTAIEVSAGTEIVVDYNAELNSGAVIGNSGNWNKAQLEYSNNPYSSGTGDTGKTPWDTVVVFTYSVTINKTNGSTSLSGAEFSLYKYIQSTNTWKELDLDVNGSVFTAKGLDDGVYKIVEDKAPEGYNSLDAPIYFTVVAGHVTDLDNATAAQIANPLTSLVYTQVDCTDEGATSEYSGTAIEFEYTTNYEEVNSVLTSIEVINKAGTQLPSTGGIGTTIFYIVGAVLVLGAGVILVTRRRTRA